MWRRHYCVTLALACISLLANPAFAGEKKRYDGYKVIRIFPDNDRQLDHLADLQSRGKFDFWTESIRRDFVDIMVSPDEKRILDADLYLRSMGSMVLIEDVQKLVDLTPSREPGRAMDWETYHRLQDIHDWIDELAAANPGWVSTEVIGQSYAGNDLKLIHINTANSDKKFWVDGGMHAREWISPATVTYIINELVNNYEQNKELVDAYDWYILPVHNPDGYEFSHTDIRLWRKTVTDHGSSLGCIGADPNRNWDFHWMETGASQDKCSEVYAGPEPFSELCCSTVRNYTMNLNSDGSVLGYFTVHSYSQMWLSPWGWTEELPPTYDDLKRVGEAGVAALEAVHGTDYIFGSVTNVLYAATGASDDWAYGVLGADFVYTLELRDTGFWGFLLPEEQIIPTGEETWAGFKAAALEMLN